MLVIAPATALAQKPADTPLQGPLTLTGSFGGDRPGPIEQRAKPVTDENPIPNRTIFVAPRYPDAAAVVETRLVVPLRVTVDESGYVAEVRRLGAPMLAAWRHPLLTDDSMSSVFEALVAASTDAVKQWRYDAPKEGPIAFDVTIAFAPETEPRVVSQPMVAVAVVPPDRPTDLPVFSAAEPLDVPPVEWAEGLKPLSAYMAKILVPPTKTKHVAPVYPQDAKDAHLQGLVVIQARVELDGRISHARVLKSVPALDQAALDAVLQWEFAPLVIDGEGVAYLLTTTVVFTAP
ncbi:MAG TPA: energy transducer TonB [Vicinamibacterales bacterium]